MGWIAAELIRGSVTFRNWKLNIRTFAYMPRVAMGSQLSPVLYNTHTVIEDQIASREPRRILTLVDNSLTSTGAIISDS